MASNSKDSAFNILGSSKLNTADGKNPVSTTSTSIQPGTASGQKNSDEYRQECNKAHDALENRLRDEVKIQFLEPLVPESCITWSYKQTIRESCTFSDLRRQFRCTFQSYADLEILIGEREEVEREVVRRKRRGQRSASC